MSTIERVFQPCSFCTGAVYQGLLAAIAQERAVRRHYERCACRLEALGLQVIAHAFRFAAAQEKEHADVLTGLVIAHGGAAPAGELPLPRPVPDDPAGMLRAALLAEEEESQAVYPQLARAAQAEGCPRIATALTRIAETEGLHAKRFRQYLEAYDEGTLFRAAGGVSWVCLHCGQFHTGQEPPAKCSACQRGRGYFIRSSYHPFCVEE